MTLGVTLGKKNKTKRFRVFLFRVFVLSGRRWHGGGRLVLKTTAIDFQSATAAMQTLLLVIQKKSKTKKTFLWPLCK